MWLKTFSLSIHDHQENHLCHEKESLTKNVVQMNSSIKVLFLSLQIPSTKEFPFSNGLFTQNPYCESPKLERNSTKTKNTFKTRQKQLLKTRQFQAKKHSQIKSITIGSMCGIFAYNSDSADAKWTLGVHHSCNPWLCISSLHFSGASISGVPCPPAASRLGHFACVWQPGITKHFRYLNWRYETPI